MKHLYGRNTYDVQHRCVLGYSGNPGSTRLTSVSCAEERFLTVYPDVCGVANQPKELRDLGLFIFLI